MLDSFIVFDLRKKEKEVFFFLFFFVFRKCKRSLFVFLLKPHKSCSFWCFSSLQEEKLFSFSCFFYIKKIETTKNTQDNGSPSF